MEHRHRYLYLCLQATTGEWPDVLNYSWQKSGSVTRAFELCRDACGFDEPAPPS